ncbi:hypothetical protein COK55_29505 [Bacillus cereus]|nr:hypothetical protein COK55_29505 [Bacillus cereus]
MILVLAGSFATSVFADRTFIIPNLPKQLYRYGVGVYEGVVAHSTATSEIFKSMNLVSKVNILGFYDARSWQDKEVDGFVDVGEVFTIFRKLNMEGSVQFKVHNSIGKTYYITINEVYVYVTVYSIVHS